MRRKIEAPRAIEAGHGQLDEPLVVALHLEFRTSVLGSRVARWVAEDHVVEFTLVFEKGNGIVLDRLMALKTESTRFEIVARPIEIGSAEIHTHRRGPLERCSNACAPGIGEEI